MRTVKLKFVDLPRDYAALVALYPPRPLHDAIDERNVEEIVSEMAGHKLTGDQEDYLNLMSDLLLKYQSTRHPRRIKRRSAKERLKYLMSQSQMTPADLAALLQCSQPLISLVLAGRRNLSKPNIKKLATHFKLDAGYFL